MSRLGSLVALVCAALAGCADTSGPNPAGCAMQIEDRPATDLALTAEAPCATRLELRLRVATGDPASPVWSDAASAPLRIAGRWRVENGLAVREVAVENASGAPVRLVGLEWTADDVGLAVDRLVHNGYQSWSYSGVEHIPASLGEARGTIAHAGDDENSLGELAGVSWWGAALADASGRGLVIGADGGTVLKTYVGADGRRLRLVQGATGDAIDLGPGERRALDGLVLTLGDVGAGLDAWARRVAELHPAVTPRRPPLGGFGSWNLYYDQVTAQNVRDEAAWAASHLVPLGLTDFLLDDGYEPHWGAWTASERFGADLAALAAEQSAAGLTPTLWLAPLYVDVRDPAVGAHPEWFLRTADGEMRVFHQLNGTSVATLDVTHEGARAFLTGQLGALRSAGYRAFKLDFLYAGAIEGLRHEPVTALEAYALAMRTLRDALGDAHVLGCGAPILPSVGWVDSMRVGPDIAFVFLPEPEVRLYTGEARHTAVRAFTDAWWSLDPDVILLRGDKIDDVDAWTIAVSGALAGGNDLLGDGRQAGELRARMATHPDLLAMRDGRAARARDLTAAADPQLWPIPIVDFGVETAVPHLWEKVSADGRTHWLAVFAWQADPYRAELSLPEGAVEIAPPTADGQPSVAAHVGSAADPASSPRTIEVGRRGVRLFRWGREPHA